MEQDMVASASVMSNNKSAKGWKITAVVASLVAICGVGFGVYGMMQSSKKDNDISNMKVQIKNNDGTVTTVNASEVNTTSNDGTTVVVMDDIAEAVDSTKYIYLGAWGIKIAIPDTLRSVNYTYSSQDTLCVGAVKYHDGMQYFPDFADVTKNNPGLSCLIRKLKDGYNPTDNPLEAYTYITEGPQALYDFNNQEWEEESVREIHKMLDSSNFSLI
jgi:hypothetical protein